MTGLQFRLIAGEAPTSFDHLDTLFLCCIRCQLHETLCSRLLMELLCGLLVLAAGAVQLEGNSTEQVGPFSEGSTTYTVPVADHEPSLDISSALRQDEWAQAAERYGLLRPSLEETAIVVHCQTTRRWAVTPEGWDEIPVHPDMRPEEILADIAYWHTDLRASWEQVEWWLCRVHASSRSSNQCWIVPTMS